MVVALFVWRIFIVIVNFVFHEIGDERVTLYCLSFVQSDVGTLRALTGMYH